MKENRNKNLFVRVSDKEKNSIESNARKCRLSISEYLRQRALGYEPKVIQTDVFYSFTAKLDELCNKNLSPTAEEKLLHLIDEITAALILPSKERL
jgi:hypothetical protein